MKISLRDILVLALIALTNTLCGFVIADETVSTSGQTEVLAATLATLNLAHPIADLDANLRKGDRRFIGINGYTCSAPGVVTDEDERLSISREYGLRCLAGTSDALESKRQKVLLEKAFEYARIYNEELLKRIHDRRL